MDSSVVGVTLAKQKMSDRQPGLAREGRATAAVHTGSDGPSVPEDGQALHFLSRDQEVGVRTTAALLEPALGSVSRKHAQGWGFPPRRRAQGAGPSSAAAGPGCIPPLRGPEPGGRPRQVRKEHGTRRSQTQGRSVHAA